MYLMTHHLLYAVAVRSHRNEIESSL